MVSSGTSISSRNVTPFDILCHIGSRLRIDLALIIAAENSGIVPTYVGVLSLDRFPMFLTGKRTGYLISLGEVEFRASIQHASRSGRLSSYLVNGAIWTVQ